MANRPRTRKRVFSLRRAPDGSAFEKCDECGSMMAIALVDMHECRDKKREVKRFKGICGNQNAVNQSSFDDLPRSPFCFFMESFSKNCRDRNSIDIGRKGFEIWKNMTTEERKLYFTQAEQVNSAYTGALIKEVNDIYKVDDEADSGIVGKFDKFYQSYEDCEASDNSEGFWSAGFESLHTHELEMVQSWIIEKPNQTNFPSGPFSG